MSRTRLRLFTSIIAAFALLVVATLVLTDPRSVAVVALIIALLLYEQLTRIVRQHEEHGLRTILDAMVEGVFVTDARGRIVLTNPTLVWLAGRRLLEVGGLAYDSGHYANAENSFQRSYDLSHRPALLHNIATAAERAQPWSHGARGVP